MAAEAKDNGILEFMTPEKASELYTRIHSQGIPDLEWKFYGRRKPNELTQEVGVEQKDETNEQQQDDNQEQVEPTAFDFDESFSELQVEESIINDSLQLKRRSEPGSERKTNLSDIMSNIMSSSQVDNE